MGAGEGGHQHRAHTEEGMGFRLDLYLPNVAHVHTAGGCARGHATGAPPRLPISPGAPLRSKLPSLHVAVFKRAARALNS